MALKESRQVFHTNVDNVSSGVIERGGIASFVPGVNGLISYANALAVSGGLANPAGLVMEDVEALNHMRHPEYLNRNVSARGSVIGVATEGEFEIDFVEQNLATGESVGTYAPGDLLYLADNGQVSRSNASTASGNTRPTVGRALSALGSDGFLKVRIEL